MMKTNLDELNALTDEMIDTSDVPELDDDFFANATWRMPTEKVTVTVEIEPEVFAWFKTRHHYERDLAAALRIYAQAHQAA